MMTLLMQSFAAGLQTPQPPIGALGSTTGAVPGSSSTNVQTTNQTGSGSSSNSSQNSGGSSSSSSPSSASSPSDSSSQEGITPEAISKAAGGDKKLEAVLKKIASKPKGAAILKKALARGVTLKQGAIDGKGSGTEGETTLGAGAPTIKVESLNLDVVGHELAHAALEGGGQEVSHEKIYQIGRDIAKENGTKPVT